MKTKIKWFFVLWMMLGLQACNKEVEVEINKYNEIKIDKIPQDIIVPTKLWDLLEFKDKGMGQEKPKEYEAKEHSGSEDEGGEGKSNVKSAVQSKETVVADVNIYLVDKTPGVVKNSPLKIKLPKGGGEIDLSQYLTGVNGSFYFKIEFPELEDSDLNKVIFQSKARKRKLDNKIWGSGCSQYMDITMAFLKNMTKNGLKVNTTEQRHITLLGGTFYFSIQKETGFSVAQVTITDSNHPNLFCEKK